MTFEYQIDSTRYFFETRVEEGGQTAIMTITVLGPGQTQGAGLAVPLQEYSGTLEQLCAQVLDQAGIVIGRSLGGISDACQALRTDARKVEFVAARAQAPKPAVSGHYVFAPRIRVFDKLFASSKPDSTEVPEEELAAVEEVFGAQQVDHHEVRSYLSVGKDELIAVWREPVLGEAGIDVYGTELPFPLVTYNQPKPGKNVVAKDGKLFATQAGKFNFDSRAFWIESKMVIEGDLGYSYGNIRFQGDLEIRGQVKDRFKVWISGSLVAQQALDVHQILVGGDVKVAQGILGKSKGTLRAKGSVKAKYIENCTVDCLDKLVVSRAIFMSKVQCLREIESPTAKIIGGVTVARDSISVYDVGNDMNVHTYIHLGVDFTAERRLAAKKELLAKLEREKNALQATISSESIPSEVRVRRMRNIFREEEAAREELASIMPLLDVNEQAVLNVYGTIYPGAEIRICSLGLNIDRKMNRVRFYIDKLSGRIAYSPIRVK